VSNLSLKPAVYGDYNFIYDLQTVDDRKYYINTKTPSLDEHIKWIKKILSSKESQLFVATIRKHSVGLLRVDNLNTKVIEISIIISASHRGQSLAKRILIMLEDIVFDRKLKATIHINNIASIMTFKSVGFQKCSQNDDFSEYIKIV
jgi:RimJ/RimL family protein N-acetyltransferase